MPDARWNQNHVSVWLGKNFDQTHIGRSGFAQDAEAIRDLLSVQESGAGVVGPLRDGRNNACF